ncbi:MAG: radical SAM protein [Ignavibacteriaceae bacterium]|nr:radical SAM protein [Ignavibacteriaceae bacterium]
MNELKIKPKILFSSPWGSYPKLSIEEDPIDYFYYRNTLKQGPFQLRIFQSWHALHFIAQNLPVESTVLENPTPRSFKSEVRKGNFQIVAISFNFLLSHNVLAMAEWLKSEFPHITIIIGGYGTALFKENFPLGERLKQAVDHICCGEGIEFFRNFLSEKWNINFNSPTLTQSLLPNIQSFFRSRIPIFKQMVFVKSLGCSAGCNFCATSYHFKKRVINLISSDELFKQISREAEKYPRIKSAVIYDEDFLANLENIKAFKEGLKKNKELRTRPMHFTVFTSIRSLLQYDIKDLIEAGIGTLYIGVESLQDEVIQEEKLHKREGSITYIFNELQRNGINTLGSLIVGWDNQTIDDAKKDAEAFIKLNPTFYQIVPLHPVPGTPLWKRLKSESRLMQNYIIQDDGVGKFIFDLQSIPNMQALSLISETYKGLIKEGGPWPFRLAENLLSGYFTLKSKTDEVFLERAESYRKLLFQILPLALCTQLIFRGEHFRLRMKKFKRKVRNNFPFRYFSALLISPFMLILILLFVSISGLLNLIKPRGEQPPRIRMVYPESILN